MPGCSLTVNGTIDTFGWPENETIGTRQTAAMRDQSKRCAHLTPLNKESANETKRGYFKPSLGIRRTPYQVALPRSVAYVCVHSTCDTDVTEFDKWGRGQERRLCPLYYESGRLLPPLPLFPHEADLDTLSSQV